MVETAAEIKYLRVQAISGVSVAIKYMKEEWLQS